MCRLSGKALSVAMTSPCDQCATAVVNSPTGSASEIIRLSLDQYENVRQNPGRFCTAPGHATAAVAAGAAVIAEELDGYALVDKIGSPGRSPKNATTKESPLPIVLGGD
jgi:hypothetical protein